MKLHHTQENIERVGVETETSFTIKSTAKSFEILSSSLYTDPISAIIRELSCNAYDSHIAAGKEKIPFQIHLPNKLEPFLSIKDYGIGLSDNDILHLYTTYFDSTKTESNDYIGALGLGSKSPFSYSKSYEVISRFDGYLRSYHMFINEHGIPDVVRMLTKNTDEENGLEIKIRIEPKDFNQVINKTASTLKYFNVLPIIIGTIHFEFDKHPKTIFSTSKWKMNKSLSYNKYVAVQGQVRYHVNTSQLHTELSEYESQLLRNIHFVGFFEIGDLEVAANREEIRYNEQSKRKLIQRLRECLQHITQQVNNICKNTKNIWDTYIKLDSLSQSIFQQRDALSNIIDPSTQYQTLNHFLNNNIVYLPPHIQHHQLHSYYYTNHCSNYSRTVITKGIIPRSSTIFFMNDVPSGGITRLTKYMQSEKSKEFSTAIIIKKTKKPSLSLEYISRKFPEYKEIDSDTEYKQILSSLGNPTIQKLSEVCPPIKSVSQQRVLKSFTYLNTSWTAYNKIVKWESHQCNIEDGGLYFVLKNAKTIHANYANNQNCPINWQPSNVKDNLHHLIRLINIGEGQDKYKYEDLCGVSIPTLKKIKYESNWHDAFVLAQNGLLKIKRHLVNQQKMEKSENVLNIIKLLNNEKIRTNIIKLPTQSPFRKLMMPVIRHINVIGSTQNQNFYDFCLTLYKKLNKNDKFIIDNITYFEYNDFNQYPMLQLLKHLPTNLADFDKILQYIKLIDRQMK